MICMVYGASGFCGRHIYNSLCLYCDVIGVAFKHTEKGFAYSDATKYEMVEEDILGCRPDFIVFAAGNKGRDVPYKILYKDNVTPIRNIYKVISKHKLKTKVIFISTDSVFDGQNGRNRDNRVPDPVSNYGKTKYLAELALEPKPIHFGQINPVDFRIIRTSAVIGKGSLFFEWLRVKFMTTSSFKVYDKIFLSPTSVELLTNAIIYIIENWDTVRQPIIHICGKRMSRYQFACMVANAGNYVNIVCKDKESPRCDTSMIPSDIQKKIIHKPMETFLKELLNAL